LQKPRPDIRNGNLLLLALLARTFQPVDLRRHKLMRMGNVGSMLRVKLRRIMVEPTLLLNLLTEQLD
jgi:hypothetical protein